MFIVQVLLAFFSPAIFMNISSNSELISFQMSEPNLYWCYQLSHSDPSGKPISFHSLALLLLLSEQSIKHP